jgi:galactokinase
MADSALKYTFLQRAQNIANMMATLDAAIKDAGQVLVNQGWNAGGADPIVQGDIPDTAGFTAAEALAFFITAGKYNTFMNGGALSADVTVRATIDRMRSSFSI